MRRWIVAGVLAAAVAVGVGPVQAQSSTGQALQAVVDSVAAAHPELPGLAVHVEAPRLHLSWTGTAGDADRTARRPLTAGDAYRIASNTKTYVAAGILRLWESGRLGLDDPIERRLSPASVATLRRGGYDPAQITIRQVLSHTSGLYDYAMDTAYARRVFGDPHHRWTRGEQLELAMEVGRPYGAPGETYHYSDTGYILLGEIIERATGQGLAPALRRLLHYDRLGLRATWFETLEPQPRAVRGRAHQWAGDQDTWDFDPSLDLYGGGGIDATMPDLAVFNRALFTGGVFDRPTTIDTMLTRVEARNLTSYRFGIGEGAVLGYRAYGHSGYWNTIARYLPDLDVAIAASILQNQAEGVAGPLVEALVARLAPARARLVDSLQAAVARAAADTAVPGAILQVESPALGLTWTGAAGVSDRATNEPLRPSQPVRMASNTKTYVAAAILRLWEEGRLGLDDPISRSVPAPMLEVLRRGGYDPDRITVRLLLHHTSGLYDYAMDPGYAEAIVADPSHRWTRTEQLEFAVAHGQPYGAPGERFHYADTGYILLGEIVERLTGQDLGAALRELIGFRRLGLDRTWLESIDPDPWYAGQRAHQYLGGEDTYGFDPSFDLYGGGGLVATMDDMARFTRGLLTGAVFARASTLDTMLARPAVAAERDYRLGIYRIEAAGVEGFGHTGFWGTFSFYFPSLDLAVAGTVDQQTGGRTMIRMLADAVRLVAAAKAAGP
jgi:D-alanyl-D-alanine carboxypeptidase